MIDVLYILFSAYVVFTICDVHRASCQHETNEFSKVKKSWLHFFIIQQAWSIGSLAVVALVAWGII